MKPLVHVRRAIPWVRPLYAAEGPASGSRHAAATSACIAIALLCACQSGDGQRAGPSLDLQADSMGIVPNVREIRVRGRRDLVENSGAAMSIAQPGVWFTINDSGNDPVLFALDTAGQDRGAWRITNAHNRDWETLALGPCVGAGLPSSTDPRHCLYIGEVGDNDARHRSLTIYRVPEPRAGRRGFTGDLRAVALSFAYDQGPRDVEAMYAGPDGTLFFISKRALEDVAGRARPALVFALPPDVWLRPDSSAVAVLIDSLPIIPGSALGRQITGAERSRNGAAVGVRTYTQLYVFRADSATGRIDPTAPPTICSIAALDERQGEGLGWIGDRGEWLLTSEGRNEPLWAVECPATKPN